MKAKAVAPLSDSLPILDQFGPEPGYEIENLLCLSYSLNPAVASALLVLCLPDLGRELSDIDPSRLKKHEIRRAVKDIVPRTTFVINGHNSIQGVDRMREFEHLIMHQVEKAGSRLSRGKRLRGSFHPKLLLALYRPRWDEKILPHAKLYLGSRNFTLDLAQEFGTVMPLISDSPYPEFATELSNFLLSAVARELRGKEAKNRIADIARVVKTLHLAPPRMPDVEAMTFHWQDRNAPSTYLWPKLNAHFKTANSIGIVSPWLKPTQCDHLHLIKGCKKFAVRCLGTEIKALQSFAVDSPQKLELALGSEYSIYDLASKDPNRESEPPLHMKYYYANHKRKQTLFFGSANFTNSGLGPSPLLNTEILAQYDLKSIHYFLSGHAYEAEDLPPKEEDLNEQFHQEWIDALELYWKEFRRSITLELPLFEIPITRWHELRLDSFTVNSPKSANKQEESENIDDSGEADQARGSSFPLGACSPHKGCFPTEMTTEVPETIEDTDISALIRVTLQWRRGKSVTTTKIVPVPEKILELLNHEKYLPASLTMTVADCLEALAELVDGAGGGGGGPGGGESSSTLDRLIDSITLDRFAYRMAILKQEDADSFRGGIERAREILMELDDLSLRRGTSEAKLLVEFRGALKCILDQLGGPAK